MIVANSKPLPVLRHLAMLLPAAGVFLFNALSVKTSSLLLAITAMDPEIIGKVRQMMAYTWRQTDRTHTEYSQTCFVSSFVTSRHETQNSNQ